MIGPARLAARARLLLDRSLTLGDLFDTAVEGLRKVLRDIEAV